MNLEQLPSDLPIPVDDGAADHLRGLPLPSLVLPTTAGGTVDVSTVGRPWAVIFVYPMTGRPGIPLPTGWDFIPGARGCTPEACGFRDQYTALREAGTDVFGLSSQSTSYQSEAAERLHLPFALLSDEHLVLADRLRLPTFTVDAMVLYKRLTLIIRDGRIEHVFYPVFPPDQHAGDVLAWLRSTGADRGG